LDLRRIRGVRGRVVPMCRLEAESPNEKGRRGKRQPIHDLYQNLLNLQLHPRMARRTERMDAGSACSRADSGRKRVPLLQNGNPHSRYISAEVIDSA
jgi:hypothetical protein